MSYVKDQSREHGIPYTPPYIPYTFQAFVDASDVEPDSATRNYTTPTNPFARKKILFICGTADRFVLEGYDNFLDRVFIDEANGGSKSVVMLEGVTHMPVRAMMNEMAKYVWVAGLAPQDGPTAPSKAML